MQVNQPHIPHIQIDRFEPVKDDEPRSRKVVNNPDVDIISSPDQVGDGKAIFAEGSDRIINLSRYRTSMDILMTFRKKLQSELSFFLEKYG